MVIYGKLDNSVTSCYRRSATLKIARCGARVAPRSFSRLEKRIMRKARAVQYFRFGYRLAIDNRVS